MFALCCDRWNKKMRIVKSDGSGSLPEASNKKFRILIFLFPPQPSWRPLRLNSMCISFCSADITY